MRLESLLGLWVPSGASEDGGGTDVDLQPENCRWAVTEGVHVLSVCKFRRLNYCLGLMSKAVQPFSCLLQSVQTARICAPSQRTHTADTCRQNLLKKILRNLIRRSPLIFSDPIPKMLYNESSPRRLKNPPQDLKDLLAKYRCDTTPPGPSREVQVLTSHSCSETWIKQVV